MRYCVAMGIPVHYQRYRVKLEQYIQSYKYTIHCHLYHYKSTQPNFFQSITFFSLFHFSCQSNFGLSIKHIEKSNKLGRRRRIPQIERFILWNISRYIEREWKKRKVRIYYYSIQIYDDNKLFIIIKLMMMVI